MALRSLSTCRIPHCLRRAEAGTVQPAIRRFAVVARELLLPCIHAVSTADHVAVPDEAHSTTSASGWEATATRPSRPVPAMTTPEKSLAARRSTAAPVAIAATRGR